MKSRRCCGCYGVCDVEVVMAVCCGGVKVETLFWCRQVLNTRFRRRRASLVTGEAEMTRGKKTLSCFRDKQGDLAPCGQVKGGRRTWGSRQHRCSTQGAWVSRRYRFTDHIGRYLPCANGSSLRLWEGKGVARVRAYTCSTYGRNMTPRRSSSFGYSSWRLPSRSLPSGRRPGHPRQPSSSDILTAIQGHRDTFRRVLHMQLD